MIPATVQYIVVFILIAAAIFYIVFRYIYKKENPCNGCALHDQCRRAERDKRIRRGAGGNGCDEPGRK